ncbi:glycoside hydrolase family 25 protein [Nonomuraea sp. NPDC059194]|uniref:glycoside hydrolase family 25 protein n=1 Tax=Nonomuraea sp. NPDC059194 TaxID=3346764 RepID=UPI00368F37AE
MKRVLDGIDVSNWQATVDWGRHADEGVAFGFAKATEGGTWVDKSFERNWQLMREHWMVCGAYHYAKPKGDPGEQARHFLRTIGNAGGLRRGDLVALDLESADGLPPDQVARFARRWCGQIVEHAGLRPFIYTYAWFADEGNCAGLGEYPLWIAAHGRAKGSPVVPMPWRGWAIHQYSTSPIDRNVFRGSREDLTRLGYDPR